MASNPVVPDAVITPIHLEFLIISSDVSVGETILMLGRFETFYKIWDFSNQPLLGVL